MKAKMTEREVMIDRWSKLAGLAYDMKHDDGLLELFRADNLVPKETALDGYGLREEDARDFVADIEDLRLSGWWVGDVLIKPTRE